MSEGERDAFLAGGLTMLHLLPGRRTARRACAVCWHDWHDGYSGSCRASGPAGPGYLEHDGRLAFVVDDPETMEKVIGEGVAELVERPNVGGEWVEVATRMAIRYLGKDGPST